MVTAEKKRYFKFIATDYWCSCDDQTWINQLSNNVLRVVYTCSTWNNLDFISEVNVDIEIERFCERKKNGLYSSV